MNFNSFNDRAANNSYPPDSCLKDYTYLVKPISSPTATLNSLTFDALSRTLTIQSSDLTEIGVYNVIITGFVSEYPSRNATTSFILNITDPCLKTQLNVPDNLPTNMTTSVLIQSSPGGFPFF